METKDSTVVDAVRELSPVIAGRADEVEAGERIPTSLHEQLAEAGIYRAMLPRSHGGEGLAGVDVLPIIEALAEADGSVGWTMMIGIQGPCLASLLPRETFDTLYADPNTSIGGVTGAQGEAQVVDGGYLVSGKWAFASGCDIWDFLFANCVVVEDGTPRPGLDGAPEERVVVFPRERAELLDTWHTLGLRGTGSKHFEVNELFVPEDYTFHLYLGHPCVEGMYKYPIVELAHRLVTVAIGVAQGALNELVSSATQRQRVFSRTSIAQTPTVQQRIGRAETALRAARELTRRQSERLWNGETEDDLVAQMIWTWADNAWTMEQCLDIVGACFRAYGAQGVYDGSLLQRRLRDIHTIGQHYTLNQAALTRYGGVVFGQDTGPWF